MSLSPPKTLPLPRRTVKTPVVFTSTLEYSGFKVDASKRYAYIVYNRHNGQVNEIARANLPVKDAQPRVKYNGETINTTKSYNRVSVWATNFRLDEGVPSSWCFVKRVPAPW